MHPLFDKRRYLIPFRSSLLPQIFTDTLVIGGGVAGLRAAIEAAASIKGAPGDVILLSKSAFDATNTAWAQGGIAAVLRDDDSFESHAADTIEAGAGLCDERAVDLMVEEGAQRIRELIDWNIRFDRDKKSGELHTGREGGHHASRVYHADGDATGRELQRLLLERARATEGVRIFENCFSLDLITPTAEPGSPVRGAITHHSRYGLQMIWAKTVILASGGAGQLFRETTNPRGATADGVAMAYRAGATIADMAFVQFHPTTLYLPGAHRALISEAVRGEGAHLLDASGLRFMTEVHELAELAPRDIVSRAIIRRIAQQGGSHVWLDCRGIANFQDRFPGIHALLRRFELDPAKDLIPVHPAAHYAVGGVRADEVGRTDVPGLLAAGEVTCTGFHGANRLASNSLLEGLVAGARSGRHARERAVDNGAATNGGHPAQVVSDIRPSDQGEIDLVDIRSSLRSAMWRNVGIDRVGPKLRDTQEMFDFWGRYTLDKIFDEPEAWETQNLLTVGALVARAAEWREESRGCHARSDFNEPRAEFAVHDLWRRGRPTPETVGRDELFAAGA
ncbi:MAG: L-aspartate oxidase [Phycisphaeraceae bacterium]|nr:MAG: L-aspartate oxidase [Phycisphaeraceae bacterium]